ncbi:MAG: hypothetical protein Q9M50_02890 [Methylococcales bacterium]|nr:hypothetical protein [Methylococcales bacterium]
MFLNITKKLNWFKQLVFRGKKSLDDYQQLEHIYQSINEVKTMIDATKEPYAQSYFIKGQAEGKIAGLVEGRTEGRSQGRTEGRTEATLSSLIIVLESRFDPLSVQQKQLLFNLNEPSLFPLLKKAATIESLSHFFQDIS